MNNNVIFILKHCYNILHLLLFLHTLFCFLSYVISHHRNHIIFCYCCSNTSNWQTGFFNMSVTSGFCSWKMAQQRLAFWQQLYNTVILVAHFGGACFEYLVCQIKFHLAVFQKSLLQLLLNLFRKNYGWTVFLTLVSASSSLVSNDSIKWVTIW